MIATLLAIPLVIWDLAASSGDFVATGEADQWEWGVPVGPPGGSAPVWGTNLAGLYLNDSEDHLELPIPDLSDAAQPTLVFRHWYRILAGDRGVVEVDAGGGWQRVDPIYGYPDADGFVGEADWAFTSVDLTPFKPSPRVRFSFAADLQFADRGWYHAHVALWDGDVTPPLLEPALLPADTQDLDGPYPVRIRVEDDGALDAVTLHYSAGGSTEALAMTHLGGGVHTASIPGQGPDTRVRWRVEAVDEVGNVGAWPPVDDGDFRVYLAAPTGLAVLAGERGVGDAAVLTWTPPVSPHPVIGYHVVDVDGIRAPLVAAQPPIEVPLAPDDPRRWHVAAVYEPGLGDFSAPVDVGIEVPTLLEVSPGTVLPGETVHLRISGASLYLHDSLSTLAIDGDVAVESVRVRDAETLEAVISVAGHAVAGPRTLTVQGAHGTFAFPDALEVLDGLTAPRILEISPASLRQGYSEQLRIVASAPFAGPLVVEHGDGLVLRGEPEVDGTTARIDIGVYSDARLGPHTLILDDGVRRLVAEIEVTQRVYSGQRRCASAPPPEGGWMWMLIALAVARLRGRR